MGKGASIMTNNYQSGQTLVELLIAIAIFALTISAGFAIFYGGQSTSLNTLQAQTALRRARDGLEGARVIRDNDWNALTDGQHGILFSGGVWSFNKTSDSYNEFSRTVSVSSAGTGEKRVRSIVTWVDETNNTRQIDLLQTLSNWPNGLYGDWTDPRLLGSGDIGAGNQGTAIAYQNQRVYMTGTAAVGGNSDFFTFDVTNLNFPILKGQLNIETGLGAIAVQGNYAYVVEDPSSDFFIVNITSDTTPVRMSKITLPGGSGRSIFVSGNYAYVGTTTGLIKEFFIIDISNPLLPIVKSSVDIPGDVNGITVLGGIAYLATSDPAGEMTIYDVSIPTGPSFRSKYNPSGTTMPGKSIFAESTDRIYLGRSGSGGMMDFEYQVIDGTNPYVPTYVTSKGILNSVLGLRVSGALTFMVVGVANNEFQVYRTDPNNVVSFYGNLNITNVASGIAFYKNTAFISVRSNNALQIITSNY